MKTLHSSTFKIILTKISENLNISQKTTLFWFWVFPTFDLLLLDRCSILDRYFDLPSLLEEFMNQINAHFMESVVVSNGMSLGRGDGSDVAVAGPCRRATTT